MSDITGGAQGTQTDPFRPRPSRRTVVAGAAWAVPAVVGVNALPAWALSPPPCPDYTYTKVRAASQFLSGTLLGTRLSQVFSDPSWTSLSLLELRGLSVLTQPPSASVVVPATGATSFENNFGPAYRMSLNLGALQALTVAASVQLGSLIKTDLGAINQFAQAVYNGTANGSTGAVDNSSGVIGTSQAAGSTTYASINLKNLLNNALSGGLAGLGTFTSNITDLSLDVGAVAGRAWQEQCTNCIKRDYLLAWLKLMVDSPLVAALTTVTESTLNTLVGASSAISDALDDLVTAISVLLPTATITGPNLSVTVDYTSAGDLFPDSELVDLTLGDDEALVINLGAVLGDAYRPDGVTLNGLDPNTSLVIDGTAIAPLITELGQLASNLTTKLPSAVRIKLSLSVQTTLLGTATITVDTSLADAITGNFTVDTDGSSGIIGALATVLSGTLKTVVKTIGQTVQTLITSQTLTTAVGTAAGTLTTFINSLLEALFIDPGVLSLTANAQNVPNGASVCTLPTSAGSVPTDWGTLDGGEYNVAALRLGVVGGLSGKLVTLYLARAAVGPIIATPNP